MTMNWCAKSLSLFYPSFPCEFSQKKKKKSKGVNYLLCYVFGVHNYECFSIPISHVIKTQ